MGAAAQADIDIYVRYDVIYTDSSNDNNPVAWNVIDDTENSQNIPENCKNYKLDIETTANIFEITDGTTLKITSYYSTEYSCNNVASIFQIWGTLDPYPIYSEYINDNYENY